MYLHARSPVPPCSCLRKCPSLASWCMIFYERPKVPHFIGVAVGQGRRDRGLFARRRPARGRGERGGRRIPEVFVGAMPSSTSGFEKRTSSRCLPSDALSYQTNRTSQTGRTARMTLGVYLGEIPPPHADPAGRCTRLGVSGLGAVNSFTGIRFF